MAKVGETSAATHEEDIQIGETPATFVNKLYITTMPLGVKITFGESHPVGGTQKSHPRVAVFLQHQDVVALRRLLEDATKNITIETRPAESPEDE